MKRKQKRKRQKIQLLLCMITAGMIHPAIIFAAAMFAAAVKRCRWFTEMRGPQGVMAFICLD
jgi:hypothetical protein